MKALSFQKPFEFTLKTVGESWPQAGRIEGTLEVKSHGSAPANASIQLHLAHGDLKKVRAKAPGAFTIVTSAVNQNWTFPPEGESRSFDWAFDLEHNAPITDNLKSPFLLYGYAENASASEDNSSLLLPGILQLNIVPEPAVQEFLKTLTTTFRFVIRTQKWSKGSVETKLAPPDSRAFSSLEYLMLYTSFETDVLHVNYRFNLKKIAATPGSVEMRKEKQELEQNFSPLEYRLPSGRLNYETFETGIREALAAVENPR